MNVTDIFSMYCTGIMNAEAEAYSEKGTGGWSLGAYGVLDFQEEGKGSLKVLSKVSDF